MELLFFVINISKNISMLFPLEQGNIGLYILKGYYI